MALSHFPCLEAFVVVVALLSASPTHGLLLDHTSVHGSAYRTQNHYVNKTKSIVLHDTIRLEGSTGKDGRNILFGTVHIKDTNKQWSPTSKEQPDWVQTIFDRNTEILRNFGHKMVVRQSVRPVEPTPWQLDRCRERSASQDDCVKENQRENANWEKEEMMYHYLQEPNLTHVMILDGDAVLAQKHVDTLRELADILDKEGKDMLFTNEDWYIGGTRNVNGGLLFAKTTNFSKAFFGALVRAHQEGPSFKECSKCMSNEQYCIQGWMGSNCMGIKQNFAWATSIKYNFHPQVWMNWEGRHPITPSTANRSVLDPDLEVIHFMGIAKGVAPQILKKLEAESAPALNETNLLEEKPRTCNDGKAEVPCFDVERCAQSAPAGGKYALVLSQDSATPLRSKLPNLDAMRFIAKNHHIDIIMLISRSNATMNGNVSNSFTAEERANITAQGIKLVQVPWTIPPKMRHTPKNKNRANKHFMRLHAFALLDYDAVAFYTDDIEIQKDIMPALQCAAQGYFLSTSGPTSPLNMGFFAVKPSRPLMTATMAFARNARFNDESGWDGAGYLPHTAKYPGADLGSGFLHAFFYKKSPAAKKAMKASGVKLLARQIDYCTWNYQGRCPTPGFHCDNVRANHYGGGADCWKYGVSLHSFDTDQI